MNSIEEYFSKFLISKKLRLTTQRKIIFNEFINQSEHMDIDTLYTKVKTIDKDIGLATIYRTIKLLIEAGIVREVNIKGQKSHYEIIIGREHHDHLTCISCGENIEFIEKDLELLQEKVAERFNYVLTGHTLYLRGICKKCK